MNVPKRKPRAKPAASPSVAAPVARGVSIYNRQRKVALDRRAVGVFVGSLLEATGHAGEGLHVTFLNDAQMRELNRDTFGKDRTTNVISFPLDGVPGDEAPFLGDVIVSVDTALREATEAGMAPEERLAQLVIHGYMHILGYEHVEVDTAERRRMQRAEKTAFVKVAETVFGRLLLLDNQ
jgi:probable rRNA maturation factor